jgi:GTP-binding protein
VSAVIAILGRPNVGKSSLFNRLLKTPRALVDDLPGVTRDRSFASLEINGRVGTLVDTGGYEFAGDDPLSKSVASQVLAALDECDLALLVADGIAGPHPEDGEMARLIRKKGAPAILLVNKIDSPEREPDAHEFLALGFPRTLSVSAAHGYGIAALKDELYKHLSPPVEREAGSPPRISVVGRPNAGKSSLVNKLLGQERLVVDSAPGTTRDSVDVEIKVDGKSYVLVDTAGVRRRGRVSERLEKASVLRSLRALDQSDIAFLTVDASLGLSEQDARVAGCAFEKGRPLVILLNKWDLVKNKAEARKELRRDRDLKMSFLESAPALEVSALTGKGLEKIFPLADRIIEQYGFRVSTPELNRVLEEAVSRHCPPRAGGGRLKFYYAAQVATGPPSFVVFANRPGSVHFSYRRFLVNSLKKAFSLDLVPVRLFLRKRREDGGPARKRR